MISRERINEPRLDRSNEYPLRDRERSYEREKMNEIPPRDRSYDRASRNELRSGYNSNFANSREYINNERSKSFERRANESGHSAYMRNIESGAQEIRYTGQSLSVSETKPQGQYPTNSLDFIKQ